MSLRVVATPLRAHVTSPAPRAGGLDPAMLEAVVAGPGTAEALARLRAPDAMVVTTGQQPGLFTGPLYTVYKALSAAALARELERRWSRPVVPVFWVAGDDHDFAEARHASWLTAEGRVAAGALPPAADDANAVPLYRQRLGAGVEPILEAIAADLAPLEFAAPTIEWLARHFRADATVAESVTGALAELLAPAGILCFESTHPAVKRAAAGHIAYALESADVIADDLRARARELEAEGLDAGVSVDDRATLVMFEGEKGRDRLLRDGDGFVTRRSGQRLGRAALARQARDAPELFSPNVLLRPVIESALLPTVAYVAGPAELRYLELAAPVYERLGVPRQLPVPRWSGIMVERRVDRVLEKFELELAELFAPAGPLETRLVRAALPPAAHPAFESLRRAIGEHYGTIADAATTVDPTLEPRVQRVRRQALAGVDEVEKKLIKHLKRRQAVELDQLGRARASVFPNDMPQERALTAATFLAREGPTFVPMLLARVEAWYAGALEAVSDPAPGRERASR